MSLASASGGVLVGFFFFLLSFSRVYLGGVEKGEELGNTLSPNKEEISWGEGRLEGSLLRRRLDCGLLLGVRELPYLRFRKFDSYGVKMDAPVP